MSFQWFLNGSAIPNATNATLALANVGASDIGTYHVTISNALGSATSDPASLNVLTGAPLFRVLDLLASNSSVVDHNSLTSDDRGGIAVSRDRIYYSGDSRTASYSSADLSDGQRLERIYDGLFSDLATETAYTLANGTVPLDRGGGIVTTLLQIDDTTGAPTGPPITLDTPIVAQGPDYNSTVGIFSGFGWVLIHTGSQVYAIEIATGGVLDLGPMSSFSHAGCENWAYWGVAEFFEGAFHLVYVGSFDDNIMRIRVPDGQPEVLASFNNLSDMCCMTVLPSRSRWYFHHEGSSQFGGGNETLGYADAVLEFNRPPLISPIGTRFIFEDQPSGPIAFTAVDDPMPASNFLFSVTSTNLEVIPIENILIEGSGSNYTVNIIPLPNAYGNSIITLSTADAEGNVGSMEFGVSVRAVNDPPSFQLATNLLVALDQDGPTTNLHFATNLSPGPPNEAGQSLTWLVNTTDPSLWADPPALDLEGTLTFTPSAGLTGLVTVTLQLRDNGGGLFGGQNTSPAQTFDILILPANEPPVAQSDTFPALEDVPLPGALSATDPDQDPLTFHLRNAPALGLLVLNPDGTFLYTPPPQFHGTVEFTFVANDGQADSPLATITLQIQPVNDPPSFSPGPAPVVSEDGGPQSLVGWASDLSAGPPDEAGQALTFVLSTDAPELFEVSPALAPEGTLTFTPAANAYGTATLSIVLRDDGGTQAGGLDSSPVQEVLLTIHPVNDAPGFIAGPNLTVNEDAGSQTLPGWASTIQAGPDNESDQTVSFDLSVDQPQLFAVLPALSAQGVLTFTPAADQHGTATLSIVLRDDGGTQAGGVDTSPAQTVVLTIHPVNDAPSFIAGPNLTVQEDAGSQTLPGWASAIRPGPENESDQTLSFALSVDQPQLFAALPALSAEGTLSFTPAPNQHGQAAVTVTLQDDGGTERGGQDTSPAQTVVLTIHPVNDAPVAQAQSVETQEDTPVLITLSGSDEDGDSLSYQIESWPAHGVLSGAGAQWTYQPSADYHGPDGFSFRVSDGALESEAAVVSLEVSSVNDAPVAVVAVGPLVELVPGQSEPKVLAPDNQGAWVELDGSQSSDVEGDELTHLWLEPGQWVAFATGAVVTNHFPIGWHTVVLLVEDGQATGQAEETFEVITPSMALEEVVLLIGQSGLPRNRIQPLIASLKAAMASFDRESWVSGINQLGAFQNKVRSQVTPLDPQLGQDLNRAVQIILQTIQ